MASGSSRNGGHHNSHLAVIGTERRFEDVLSDEDDVEDLPSFLQTSQPSKRTRQSPPRKPRSSKFKPSIRL